jgi:hypothetical protein
MFAVLRESQPALHSSTRLIARDAGEGGNCLTRDGPGYCERQHS